MLADELDDGVTPMHPDVMEASVRFRKISPWGACTPSRMTKLGIKSPPSPSQACQRDGLTTTDQVSVMLHVFLKPFCLTCAHVHCNVTSCQVEVKVLIVGCNSHRVDEES